MSADGIADFVVRIVAAEEWADDRQCDDAKIITCLFDAADQLEGAGFKHAVGGRRLQLDGLIDALYAMALGVYDESQVGAA